MSQIARPPSSESLVRFFRTLAVMQGAGLTLVSALEFLANDHDPGLAAVSQTLLSQVRAGKPLSEGMRLCTGVFSPYQLSSVTVGENDGKLSETLQRLADAEEKRIAIGLRLKAALLQPALLLILVVVGMGFFMPGFVFRAYLDLVDTLEIPATGGFGIILDFMRATQRPAFWIISVGLVVALGAVLWSPTQREVLFRSLLRVLARMPRAGVYFQGVYARGRSWEGLLAGFEALVLVSPLASTLGKTLQSAFSARFATALASQLDAGIPALHALRPAIEASGSRLLQLHQSQIEGMLSEGNSLCASLGTAELLPDLLGQMIFVGEESGQLPEMCQKAAEYYAQELEYSLESALSLLEPLVIAILGIVMGCCAVLMLYPLVKVIEAL